MKSNQTDKAMANTGRGLTGHHKPYEGDTNEWLTPKNILAALGKFELDPCSPVDRTWDTAKKHYNKVDNGLIRPWKGRVWMNPPYGPHTKHWLAKMKEHNNGIVLIFSRTETRMFFDYVWDQCSAILFLGGRLRFLSADGTTADNNAGCGSVLIAYDNQPSTLNHDQLQRCGLRGKFVSFRRKGR